MQKKVIELGNDPNNTKPVKDLNKEKDNELHVLKKKLKIQDTQHIQTPDIVALEEERDKIYKEILMYKEQVTQLR